MFVIIWTLAIAAALVVFALDGPTWFAGLFAVAVFSYAYVFTGLWDALRVYRARR